LIKFNLAPVTDAENGVTVKLIQQKDISSAWSNLPFKQLPGQLRYGNMGGIPPFFRSGIVRVAFAKLSATGVLSALVAISASDREAAFSCALAAAVNSVAAVHYHYILRIRAQDLPSGLLQFSSGRNLKGEWVGDEDKDYDDAKLFLQEMAVDGLRHSDWAVTLPLMVLDLYRLTDHATQGATSWMDQYLAAALMPVMVLLGVMYRFYANELRGNEEHSVDGLQVLVGVVGFVGSCVVFGLVVSGILDPIENELCVGREDAASDGRCPITDTKLKYDRDAVRILTYVWIGYPIVSIISRVMIKTYGKPSESQNCLTYAQYSLFKDASYAVLDVVSKGGLALYACYRTTWVQ